jgi:histidine ammonia-lyase
MHAPVTAPFRLGDDPLSLESIAQIARGGRRVEIGPTALAAMKRSRAVVDRVVAGGDSAPAV